MADQVPLFPGNRGCGKRERGAGFVIVPNTGVDHESHEITSEGVKPRCVIVRIAGLKTEPKNRSGFASKRGAMGQARKIRESRARVTAMILDVLQPNAKWMKPVVVKLGGTKRRVERVVTPCRTPAPSRVVLTRLSSGSLDRGAIWEAMKPVWDGVADAFGLESDKELQEDGDVAQAKCAPKTCGVVIELFFSA